MVCNRFLSADNYPVILSKSLNKELSAPRFNMYIHCSNSRIVKEIIHLNDCAGGCIIFCVW